MARTVAEFCRTLVCDINALPVDLVAQEVERQVRRFMTEHLEDEHHCTVGDCRGCR